jgi:hypothetical protein
VELCGTHASQKGDLLLLRSGQRLFIHDPSRGRIDLYPDGDWAPQGMLPDDTWEAILMKCRATGGPLVVAFTWDTAVSSMLDGEAATRLWNFPCPWPDVRCHMLARPLLAWMLDGEGTLHAAGIRDPDHVMVGTVPLSGEGAATLRTLPLDRPALAVCWHFPGELAVVHAGGVTWAKAVPEKCWAVSTTPADLTGAVAAASSPLTREIWVVFEDGEIDRVPWPG